MSLFALTVAGALGLAQLASALTAPFYVDTSSTRVVDSLGRERFFHGTNVVFKGFPFHPRTDAFDPELSFTDEDMQLLKDANQNVVRLSVMWPGFEPQRGQYNYTYLETIMSIVKKCEEYGLYVVLDQHQDVLSERFCGEGIPMWAVRPGVLRPKFPEPIARSYATTNDIPDQADCNTQDWAKYHLTFQASAAYQNWYQNADNTADSFAFFWKEVARYARPYSNVIGYELLNEPWAGDVYRNPTLLVPGVADSKNLGPFYDRVAAQIRQVDTERMIIFASVTWQDFIPAGFDSVPGGIQYANRSALAFHYYRLPNFDIGLQISWRKDDQYRLGGAAGFMTEFETFPGETTLDAQLDAMEGKLLTGWMNWEFKSFIPITGANSGYFDPNTRGAINENVVRSFSRPYATAVAGKTTLSKYDRETGVYRLEFIPFPVAVRNGVPTVIAVDNLGMHYPAGFTVKVTPEDAASVTLKTSTSVEVVASRAGGVVAVELVPV